VISIPRVLEGDPTAGEGLRVAVVVSRFNDEVTRRLLEGALGALGAAGVRDQDITVAWVPGAFEIPATARRLADTHDAVVCLGAVIRGETAHFEYVSQAVTEGLTRLAAEAPCPVTFGVLTTYVDEQALQRAGGIYGNKGADAVAAALEVVSLWRRLRGA
jgi:6,7-dimethyl-8-ribityllumazine synthase